MKSFVFLCLIFPVFLKGEILQMTFHLQPSSCSGCAAGKMRIIQKAESVEKAELQLKENRVLVTLKAPFTTSLEPVKNYVRSATFIFHSVDALVAGTLRQEGVKYFLDVSQTKLSFELQIGPHSPPHALKALREVAGKTVKLLGKEVAGKPVPTLEFLAFKN